ncbi:ankyrin repeat domain-containing protein [Brachyspira pulli]|uniref:ankyrin repeat domain-containing protein n=1 Tax=Brachyspira pulli TaxID=310721 RepID=UPI003005F38D
MKKIIFALMILTLSINLYALTKNEKAFLKAAENGDIETVRYLINSEVDIDAQDNDGNTALSIAVLSGNSSTVKLLLDYSADHSIKNKYGQTAMDIAKKEKNYEIIGILEHYRK